MQLDSYKKSAVIFLATYLLLRVLPDFVFWRNLEAFYSYLFECIFVFSVYFFFKAQVRFLFLKEDLYFSFLPALIGGFLIHQLATRSGIVIPFNLSSPETIFLLLILAPILEEFIFRMALWEPLSVLFKSKSNVLILTSVLFSLGHFMAFFVVPYEYRVFVLYQTLYVILLGLACGWRRWVTGSVLSAIFLHFGFNLGFLIAAKL